MKKLSDYKGQKIAIHFPTYELWLRRKEINPIDDCKDYYWEQYKEKTGYCLGYAGNSGGFSSIGFYKREGYTILPATDFLEEEFVYGQEYEFSHNNEEWHKRIYLCKTPNNIFIAWNKNTQTDWNWKYCRKINPERTEAITTAKELISKFDIKQEEIY